MNLDTSLFVKNLVIGTVSYLKEIDFDLSAEQENTLESSLIRELNCLLYTSPSPRDNGRSRMPSSA